jgi:hypothetical protein
MTAETKKTFGDRYLRNRPFLVISTIARPAKGIRTYKQGWADTSSNWATFEQPQIVDRVSNKHLTEASVIIDILNRAVVKNRHSDGNDDKLAVEHFLTKYTELVTEGLVQFARNSGLVNEATVAAAAAEADAEEAAAAE